MPSKRDPILSPQAVKFRHKVEFRLDAMDKLNTLIKEGYSVKQASDIIGVPYTTIRRWEKIRR